jgi:hypothetical protein
MTPELCGIIFVIELICYFCAIKFSEVELIVSIYIT